MHLPEADLILYIENRLDEDGRKRVEGHIAGCAACANQFAAIARIPSVLLHEPDIKVDARTRRHVEHLARPKRRGFSLFDFFHPPVRLALAGLFAVAITAASYTYFFMKSKPEASEFRSREVVRGFTAVSPPDQATVVETPVTFRWRATSPAGYRFQLLDESGVPLWTAFVRDTVLRLPPSIVLESGKTYLWSIESPFADSTLERFKPHAFTYRPVE